MIKKALYGRGHLRVRADPESPIHLHINHLAQFHSVNAHDISEGGLSFTLPGDVSESIIGTPLSIAVEFVGLKANKFVVFAEVRHISKLVYGIEFCDLEPENRAVIARYVKMVEKKYPQLSMKSYRPPKSA